MGEAASVRAGPGAGPVHDPAARAAAAEVAAAGGPRDGRGDRRDASFRDRLPALGLRRAEDRDGAAARGMARAGAERERPRAVPPARQGRGTGVTEAVAVLAAAELPPGARTTVEA